jgi:hypothetical protein
MTFSNYSILKSIKSNKDELAWKIEDIPNVIRELIENNIAILGGDIWAIIKDNGIHSNVLARIDAQNIALGTIKGKDNIDYIFSWHCDKNLNETWRSFVLRSAAETENIIENMAAENIVMEEYSNSLYYNLIFVSEKEFSLTK